MNANELADELEMRQVAQYGDKELTVAPTDIHKQAATMLRQQQAEIENLKQWERRHLDVIHSLERQLEVIREANTRSRP